MELGQPPLVETAASLFRELCYNYRDSLTAGILIAGWDRRKGGQIYSVPIGGMCVRQNVSVGGSGSSYIYGFVDANYKTQMKKEDCVNFITKCEFVAVVFARVFYVFFLQLLLWRCQEMVLQVV